MRAAKFALIAVQLAGGPLALIPRAFGDDLPPVRIVRGLLIEWDMQGLAGEFSVRQTDNHVQRCRVTPETYMTRHASGLRVRPEGVKAGDFLEVVADLRNGPSRCQALTIYIGVSDPERRSPRLPSPSPPSRLMETLSPRGRLTFAGVVQKLEANRMTVQTRNDGPKTFQLRSDTLFSAEGRVVERDKLQVHTHVFVRAGNGLYGEIEAYQVVWGDILQTGAGAEK